MGGLRIVYNHFQAKLIRAEPFCVNVPQPQVKYAHSSANSLLAMSSDYGVSIVLKCILLLIYYNNYYIYMIFISDHLWLRAY